MKRIKSLVACISSLIIVSSIGVINVDAMGLGHTYDILTSKMEYTVPANYDFTIYDIEDLSIIENEKYYHDMLEDPLIGSVTYGDNPLTLEILIEDNPQADNIYNVLVSNSEYKSALTLKTELIPNENDTSKATFVISFEDDFYMDDYNPLTVDIIYQNDDFLNEETANKPTIGESSEPSEETLQRGDINGDGKINVLDLLQLKKYILKIIDTLD